MAQTKVVRVPVRIPDEDEVIRKIKYIALNKVMSEARYLGNMAIRYAIAFRLKGIENEIDPKSGKPVPLDTRIYRILAKERKHLPAGNMATLARNFAAKAVRTADKDAWAGRKSLPTYRSIFVPFRKKGTTITETIVDGVRQFSIKPQGFSGSSWLSDDLAKESAKSEDIILEKNDKKLELMSHFSWKDGGAVSVLKRIVSGEYSLCDSQIQRGDKGLMALLTYKFNPEKPALDPEKICGVDLGVVIPAVCASNNGPQRFYLGDGGDVWAARSKFRAQRRRQQRRKGMYSKTKRWSRSDAENRWIRTYYHKLTRGVIKFCLQYGCGTIHMEDLSTLRSKDMESEYRRLMWVPSKFYELLKYKAEEVGIEIVKINPRNTSRRCSKCGHISKGNRPSQDKFICELCGDPKKPINADYNAALNIALASGDVIRTGYIEEDSSAA